MNEADESRPERVLPATLSYATPVSPERRALSPSRALRFLAYAVLALGLLRVDRVVPPGIAQLALGAVAVMLVYVRRSGLATTTDRDRRDQRAAMLILSFGLLVMFSFHECVHATTFYFDKVGLSYSEFGGPCNIGVHRPGRHLIGPFYLTTRW